MPTPPPVYPTTVAYSATTLTQPPVYPTALAYPASTLTHPPVYPTALAYPGSTLSHPPVHLAPVTYPSHHRYPPPVHLAPVAYPSHHCYPPPVHLAPVAYPSHHRYPPPVHLASSRTLRTTITHPPVHLAPVTYPSHHRYPSHHPRKLTLEGEQEPDLGEEPPDEVREEDQEDNDEEEGEKEVTEMVYQLMRLAVNGHIEQTLHEYVEVDPGHKDSGEEVLSGGGMMGGGQQGRRVTALRHKCAVVGSYYLWSALTSAPFGLLALPTDTTTSWGSEINIKAARGGMDCHLTNEARTLSADPAVPAVPNFNPDSINTDNITRGLMAQVQPWEMLVVGSNRPPEVFGKVVTHTSTVSGSSERGLYGFLRRSL
ncbi:hypothetical protein C8F04DRAFT_1200787 [Mycena alexandri]|uniref:Uncharacterized protein n=1 Tax=Mycena alexandri TaxID=1745969 RepID=A0AAD6WLS7_9AGAR|nr:hypothetical protein C8F04DRAFT_1200787 [Mycena alexandri]